ncbi:lysine-2,3-aminomutase-like protein [Ponticaulis sp.]|uniref:lysine-2,3-aminomutase-like protein n=1 Tax=Ponticaulis sp. TaxID=2020902 RepID=UPI00262C74ED|nr:lysine-2,3-aminomutase-like protein [Ponticaulis sp.]MDF1679105.1 lysine-2,3-aminomutase-like protein [Ponticaulis sp.]
MSSRPLSSPVALASAGLVSDEEAEALKPVADRYAIAVTPFLADRIDQNDPADPIARMFIPSPAELVRLPEELNDPIGDASHSPVAGIVHRYPNRVLLKPVAVCPVYCRFCFRREMVGPDLGDTLTPAELDAALDYIRSQPEVKEVILTGGDPFMLSAKRARALTDAIANIPHVKIIRWHTRMPVADPARITPEFIGGLKADGVATYVSIHINHLKELSDETKAAARLMADAGIALVSQTVLLNGVNNSVEALSDLFEALTENLIRPYYLHHPDLAPGTSHFRVSVEEGRALYDAVRDRVSGLSVPRYVIDIPGGVSKANAAQSDLRKTPDGPALRGRDGKLHPYKT